MAIKGVMLDLDHTLYDYDICNEAGLKVVFRRLSKEYKISEDIVSEKFKLARDSVKIDLVGSGSSHSRVLYFKKLIETLSGKTDATLILEVESSYWNEYFRLMVLYDYVKDFLKFCREKKIKVVIVTDLTAKIQLRKIVALGINEYVDYVITSEEAGKEKPSPYVYYLALDKLKCKPEETIMVGDDCEKDFLGAENLGIKAYNICDKAQWKDYEDWLKGVPSFCCMPKTKEKKKG